MASCTKRAKRLTMWAKLDSYGRCKHLKARIVPTCFIERSVLLEVDDGCGRCARKMDLFHLYMLFIESIIRARAHCGCTEHEEVPSTSQCGVSVRVWVCIRACQQGVKAPAAWVQTAPEEQTTSLKPVSVGTILSSQIRDLFFGSRAVPTVRQMTPPKRRAATVAENKEKRERMIGCHRGPTNRSFTVRAFPQKKRWTRVLIQHRRQTRFPTHIQISSKNSRFTAGPRPRGMSQRGDRSSCLPRARQQNPRACCLFHAFPQMHFPAAAPK